VSCCCPVPGLREELACAAAMIGYLYRRGGAREVERAVKERRKRLLFGFWLFTASLRHAAGGARRSEGKEKPNPNRPPLLSKKVACRRGGCRADCAFRTGG
jgi:hypothetical protein